MITITLTSRIPGTRAFYINKTDAAGRNSIEIYLDIEGNSGCYFDAAAGREAYLQSSETSQLNSVIPANVSNRSEVNGCSDFAVDSGTVVHGESSSEE